ncbi:hypothetical protein TNCV_3585801 [Trichonephila clavipes]|nr:hypothetical protein TNCV_3585801 [Trichonephila clavipes]
MQEKLCAAQETYMLSIAFSTSKKEQIGPNDSISGPLLCEKALELYEKLGGSADFKASTGWLKNFKSRLGIRELQTEGEPLSGIVQRKLSDYFTQYRSHPASGD